MSFSVTKKAPVLVAPAEETHTGGCLPLSFFDRLPAVNFFVEVLFVFRHGDEPAKVIREALAKVLVPYYPVAGRLVKDADDGKLQVACTGEGLWFVEASAGFGLEDVEYLECQPLRMPKEELLPLLPLDIDQSEVPFMMLQVTEFKCGGFTVGFRGSHIMFDAIGAGQFKIAMGEMARGLAQPTTAPLWCRDAIPSPPSLQDEIQLVHSPALAASKFEHYAADVSLDVVKQLQNHLSEEKGQRISVFDVVAAKLWQCRTRAIDQPPESDVTLSFPANIRQELRKELPAEGGYYGNCTFPFVVKATSGQIASATLSEIVSLITEAKMSLPTKVSRFLDGEKDGKGDLSMLTYGTTNLTDMRRVGFSDVDYGWGPPSHVVPLVDGPVNLCLIVSSPMGKKHIRLLTHCVVKEHLQAFRDELKALA
ncbi:putative 3'-N-debenzoyl-2'-deoxytaxol N-benzoyltransferase [Iris pallida]|uniref:3'-N-debenzoyl-2'-deoxytaxol N-benzoyltransferase n=1 Tax=Iris pallida TaxID=29817 RepID=A0AAX6F3B0_IRIPA|nr:putative 3'-N-debenzoyl-2'-deoxytaxol N-benzoyltransferase [Iris pallida]